MRGRCDGESVRVKMRDHMTEWSVRFCEVDRLAMSSSVGSEGDDYYASACGERKV